LAHLETALPKIAVNVDRINIEGFGIYDGTINISNIGEGVLVGEIASPCDFLEFSQTEFSAANSAQIDFQLDLNNAVSQRLPVIITTNGGEKTVFLDIKIIPPAMTSGDGTQIADLKQLCDYAKRDIAGAKNLFGSGRKEFMLWLFNIGYKSIDIYEVFAADPNKERALDNFLVFSGLKSKAEIVIENPRIKHRISAESMDGSADAITGAIIVKRSSWGYFEDDVSIAEDAPWLQLAKDKLVSSDFDENGICEIGYILLLDKIKPNTNFVHTKVSLGLNLNLGNKTVEISCIFMPLFEAKIDKSSYNFDDKGILKIANNSGRDMMIDVHCESFVRFSAERYLVGKTAEIPFEIKFSAIKAAGLLMKKQLNAKTKIDVVAGSGDKRCVRRVNLKLWQKI